MRSRENQAVVEHRKTRTQEGNLQNKTGNNWAKNPNHDCVGPSLNIFLICCLCLSAPGLLALKLNL